MYLLDASRARKSESVNNLESCRHCWSPSFPFGVLSWRGGGFQDCYPVLMPQRFLRPGITDSERWNACCWQVQSFYIRLITLVDDYGRYDANPKMLRGHAFALRDDVSTERVFEMCKELAEKELAVFYEVLGKQYLQITNWHEKARSNKSKFPAYDNTCKQMFTDVIKCLPPSSSPLVIAISHKPSDVFVLLKKELSDFYEATRPWNHFEETTLHEICQQHPDSMNEFRLITAYHSSLPLKDKKFFPQSVEKLLIGWNKTLDAAKVSAKLNGASTYRRTPQEQAALDAFNATNP